MPHTTINPTRMTPEQARLLFTFFAHHPNNNFWEHKKEYPLSNTDDNQSISFTHKLLRRSRHNTRNEEGTRIECIEPRAFTRGGTASIFNSQGTLQTDEEAGVVVFKGTKRRVVKVKKDPIQGPNPDTELLRSTLHMKPHVRVGSKNYSVMRRQPGAELLSVLNDERRERNPVFLTVKKRMELSFALLKALKTQAFDVGLIHRDVKPENIMVDMQEEAIVVNLIDYDFCCPHDAGPEDACCTLHYAAPEQLMLNKQTNKCDVYSMGRVLQLVWGDDNASFNEEDRFKVFLNARTISLDKLFNYLPPEHNRVSLYNQKIIKDTIAKMLDRNPLRRPSIIEAIEAFSRLDFNNDPDIELIRQPAPAAPTDSAYGLGFGSDSEEENEDSRASSTLNFGVGI